MSESTALSPEAINQLFNTHRTVNHFTDQEVTDEQLKEIYELTKMGPTAFNSQPLRITYLRSAESRARLIPHLVESNREKAEKAPVTAVLSFDTNWSERFPEFNPRAAGMREMFRDNEGVRHSSGLLSSSIAAGYFIIATRALGLAAGPMTGADFEGITQEFFPDGERKAFLAVNLGYGVLPEYDRNPRFSFDEAAEIL